MSLREQVIASLDSLACGETLPAGARTIKVDAEGMRLECELLSVGPLGCLLSRMTLHTDRLADVSSGRLRGLSQQLSERLTYLLEPISPIEIDPDGCTVQMRSNPPHQDDGQTSYYELMVRRGGSLGLSRYTATRGSERHMIAAQVTREVLARLIDDFVAVVS